MNQDIGQRVTALLEPAVTEKGLELVDVEYLKEGTHWFLRIYIDKEGGIGLDDCTDISHVTSELLDKADFIQQAYTLEVSSPGLERPLKKETDYERYRGKLIKVRTTVPFQGYQEYSGYLSGLDGGEVVLKYQEVQVRIPYQLIKKAHLAIEF
ncbi:MAG: ribosome maturation factor RimP [Desulfitobacteriaceae bacterium]